MTKTTKKILMKIPTLLLAAAPIVAYDLGSLFFWGEPKMPAHLCKKD